MEIGYFGVADFLLGVIFFGAGSPAIPENSDLDDYTGAGSYHVTSATVARAIDNIPYTSTGGTLLVITAYNGSNYIIQIYICVRAIYARKKQSSWTEWTSISQFTTQS